MRIKTLCAAIGNAVLLLLLGLGVVSLWRELTVPSIRRLPPRATAPAAAATSVERTPATGNNPARTIDWDDLLPAGESLGAGNIPAAVHSRSGEDAPIPAQLRGAAVNAKLDGVRVRLPGFVVPLELDDRGGVRKLLIVPYVGACIHVPAPPPNQIVYAELDVGARTSPYDAYWVTGRMTMTSTTTRLAAAAYSLRADKVEPYR